jgi:hypothetical protein
MNSTEIEFEIKGKISVAPIHQHYVLAHLQTIMKEFTELEREGCSENGLTFDLKLYFKPIGKAKE